MTDSCVLFIMLYLSLCLIFGEAVEFPIHSVSLPQPGCNSSRRAEAMADWKDAQPSGSTGKVPPYSLSSLPSGTSLSAYAAQATKSYTFAERMTHARLEGVSNRVSAAYASWHTPEPADSAARYEIFEGVVLGMGRAPFPTVSRVYRRA